MHSSGIIYVGINLVKAWELRMVILSEKNFFLLPQVPGMINQNQMLDMFKDMLKSLAFLHMRLFFFCLLQR